MDRAAAAPVQRAVQQAVHAVPSVRGRSDCAAAAAVAVAAAAGRSMRKNYLKEFSH
jgi:hypothetical protein